MSIIKAIKDAITQAQFVKAITLATEALNKVDEKHEVSELLYLLVVAYRLDKQFEKGLESAKRLLSENPDHARTYQEMGHIYAARANEKEAAIAFYQATRRNPALLASWLALHKLYIQMGNKQAAEISKAQIDYLKGLPRDVLGGRDLMFDGDLHKADQVCRQFLQTNKHHPEALLLLAEIGIQLKIYGEAEFLLASCLELYPDHKAAGMEYLKLLAKMGKFKDAKALANKLLAHYPSNPVLLAAKASALLGLSEVPDALSLYHQLLQQDDNQPGIHLLLGHALKASGDLPAAIAAYQKAYHYRAEFGDAYWSLANTKTYRFSENELTQMQKLVSEDEVTMDDKTHLHFALGKAFEDSLVFDQAFHHYAMGNQTKQQQIKYEPEAFERQVAAQIETCTPDLFKRLKEVGEQSDDPIFIVGLPRAGSTLLEQILASHSQVDGTMELHNILGLASRLQGPKNQYPQILSELKHSYFTRFGEQFLKETQDYRSGAPFFIDKMPNNFLHIGLIKLVLPNAKVIDARRHPMACCFSGFKQLFGDGQDFTYGLENIGRYYSSYVELMNHWDSVMPGFVLRVQHEDVIDDLEGQVRRILDFCGLPFEQKCIDFHKTERTIKTPSSEQVRQPIYRSGLDQWKNFEAHLGPLKNALIESS
ncbi:MAG: tetratricopeptide (TPR) repeat protein [Glaciecola sp.]